MSYKSGLPRAWSKREIEMHQVKEASRRGYVHTIDIEFWPPMLDALYRMVATVRGAVRWVVWRDSVLAAE